MVCLGKHWGNWHFSVIASNVVFVLSNQQSNKRSTQSVEDKQSMLQSANFGLLALFWGIFCFQLSFEWSMNDQYSYGLFVPFIGLYLLHLRWQDRPEPDVQPRAGIATMVALILIILLHYPIKIIFEANADWRMVVWTQALLVFAATVLLLRRWGGQAWLKHFSVPFLFLLTAVPWPVFLEKQFVSGLMSVVAALTVEIVNFMGIYARQAGNVIYLTNGVVSVEEACSGIRSFQSTIMSGIMLGELLRFRWSIRLALFGIAGLLALFFNFCRTLLLTWLSATRGIEVMNNWHDSAGLMVFLASFAGLIVLAIIFNKWFPNKAWKRTIKERTRSPFASKHAPRFFGIGAVVPLALAMAGTHPAVYFWYATRAQTDAVVTDWEVDWSQGSKTLSHEPISPQIKDVLHYSRGEYVKWESTQGLNWMAYFFEWDNAKSAQLGGVHNPEICLPATGWTMQEKADDFLWYNEAGLELMFNSYHFTNQRTAIYVFYCQWDPAGYPYHIKSGRFREDRLYDAWKGDRKAGKQKLEIIIQGADSLEYAKNELINFLDQAVVVTN